MYLPIGIYILTWNSYLRSNNNYCIRANLYMNFNHNFWTNQGRLIEYLQKNKNGIYLIGKMIYYSTLSALTSQE